MSQGDLDTIIEAGSRPLGPPLVDPEVLDMIPAPLKPLLTKKNGFYAYGPALYVRPWGADVSGNALWWNAVDTWRDEYQGVGDDLLFFAEDIFGFQFAISPQGFYQFDPETTEREYLGADIYEWARTMISDLDFYTGFSISDAWTEAHGRIPVGSRLAPPVPFFLGGEFDVDGLAPINDVELMRFRGDIYQQTKDLPEGAQINFEA